MYLSDDIRLVSEGCCWQLRSTSDKTCAVLRKLTRCFKKRAPFLFLRLLCVLSTDLKNVWQYCRNGNLQQQTHFKFYIYAWYLIVTQAENTPCTATVDIGLNITQQNPTLKTDNSKWKQTTVKYDQIRCSKSLPLAFRQAHQWKIRSPQRMLENDVAVFVREFGATHSLHSEFLRTTFLQTFKFKFRRTTRYAKEWWIPVFLEIWRVFQLKLNPQHCTPLLAL